MVNDNSRAQSFIEATLRAGSINYAQRSFSVTGTNAKVAWFWKEWGDASSQWDVVPLPSYNNDFKSVYIQSFDIHQLFGLLGDMHENGHINMYS